MILLLEVSHDLVMEILKIHNTFLSGGWVLG